MQDDTEFPLFVVSKVTKSGDVAMVKPSFVRVQDEFDAHQALPIFTKHRLAEEWRDELWPEYEIFNVPDAQQLLELLTEHQRTHEGWCEYVAVDPRQEQQNIAATRLVTFADILEWCAGTRRPGS